MATLKKAKNNDVRKAILEALQREFDRMSQSKLGKRVKQGAMGTSSWGKRVAAGGKRVVARGEAYAKSPARRNHTRSSMGAYARQQAAEREKNRPAREAAKQARQQQRQTRRQQRQTRRQHRQILGTSVAKKVKDIRAGRAAGTVKRTRAGQTPKRTTPQTPKRTTPQTPKRTTPQTPKRTTPQAPRSAAAGRPAADARKARAASPVTRTARARTPEGAPVARPTRTSRAPRSGGGSASKTG
jgi:hypothetical protein